MQRKQTNKQKKTNQKVSIGSYLKCFWLNNTAMGLAQ